MTPSNLGVIAQASNDFLWRLCVFAGYRAARLS